MSENSNDQSSHSYVLRPSYGALYASHSIFSEKSSHMAALSRECMRIYVPLKRGRNRKYLAEHSNQITIRRRNRIESKIHKVVDIMINMSCIFKMESKRFIIILDLSTGHSLQ